MMLLSRLRNGFKCSIAFVCCLTLCTSFWSCNEPAGERQQSTTPATPKELSINDSLIQQGAALLSDGDLVTRSDDDFESLSLQNFSQKERIYSHSGIVFLEDSAWYVYHTMAGPENPGESLMRTSFDSFVNPAKKTGFAIFRYQLSAPEVQDLHALYKKYLADQLPFDKGFNLASDDSMYCSEIIYKSLKHVSHNRLILPTSYISNFKPKTTNLHFKNSFYKKFEYVGLDDLYLNSFCQPVFKARYQ